MKYRLGAVALALLTLFAIAPTDGNAIVYQVNRSIGPDGTVTGFLETDGTLGPLVRTNFIYWSLQLTAPNLHALSPTLLLPSNSILNAGNLTLPSLSPVSATATELTFDTSVNDPIGAYFQVQGGSNVWCLQTLSVNCIVINAVAESIGNPGPVATESRSGIFVFATAGAIPAPPSLALLLTGFCAAAGLAIRRR